MNRRDFLQSSLLMTGAAALAPNPQLAAADPPATTSREYYELRLYHLRRGPMQKRFDDFFRDVAIPALNRAGVAPVGVFGVAAGPDSPTSYVLLPHRSIESLATLSDRLQADAAFARAGADFLNAAPTDPAYLRVESSLMVAFASIPRLEVPAATRENKSRLFELRLYESHNKRANKKKIEMFDTGEIALFRRTGLTPVFFGETLVGTRLPNLTYLLVFENMAERDRNWATFASDPEWKKLSSTPGFTDPEIVTNISNVFLRPTPYSQI